MTRIAMIWFPDWKTNALVIDCPPGSCAALVSARGRVTHVTREARSFWSYSRNASRLAEYMCADLIVYPTTRCQPGLSTSYLKH